MAKRSGRTPPIKPQSAARELALLRREVAELRAKQAANDAAQEAHRARKADEDFWSQAERAAFEHSGVIMLFQCVISCSEKGRPVPDWARDELAKRFRAYLNTEQSLNEALLGRRRGRLADPRTQLAQKHDDERAFAAMLQATAEGHRGDDRFARARELLAQKHPWRERPGHLVDPDRLKQLWKKQTLRPKALMHLFLDLAMSQTDPVEALPQVLDSLSRLAIARGRRKTRN